MKKSPLRLMSSVLVCAMALSFAACNKNGTQGTDTRDEGHSGQQIKDEMPWFETNIIEIKPQLDESRQIESTNTRLAGADDKYIVVYTNGGYKVPDNIDWNNFDSSKYAIATLTVIDRQSKQVVNTIDLVNRLDSTSYLLGASYADGKIKAVFNKFDVNTGFSACQEDLIDPVSGNVLSSNEKDVGNPITRDFTIGDYKIETFENYGAEQFFTVGITDKNGNLLYTDIKKPGKSIYALNAILPLENDRALALVNIENEQGFFEIDLKAGTAVEVETKDYDWLNIQYMNSLFISPTGEVYYSSSIGVSRIDIKNKTLEDVFNFSWCNENRNKLAYLEIGDCTGDTVLLCGRDPNYGAFKTGEDGTFIVADCKKADKNPNAGKTVLELYIPYGYVNEKIADAICKFNSTDPNCFIEVTGRYTEDQYINDGSQTTSQDEMDTKTLNDNAKISNKLAMDILNGEGPDILMNVSDLGQLNNSAYLVDLTKFTGELDPNKYFTNIVEGSKTDGALYQLPLCFGVEGIHTDSKYAGASGVGFTTAEYEKYLKDTLNGKDAIPSGQAIYFYRLFNGMRDKFIVNKKADFSGPEFAQLAEYVKNNVQERSPSWGNVPVEPVGLTFKGDTTDSATWTGYYGTSYGIGSFFYSLSGSNGKDLTILGLPSTDGRGPMFSIHVSVAVSAQSKNIDACGEFVKLLLSDEIMESLGNNDEFVLSRTAFRKVSETAVEFYNGKGGDNIFSSNSKRIKFTTEHIDKVEKIILNCSRSTVSDASICLILIEEMPAYFSGQKDLASVIAIAQDRVQKVLDERG